MTRDEADHALRSMIWGAKTSGDAESVNRLEALRATLPEGPLPLEWTETFRKLLEWAFPAAWTAVDLNKLHFAFAFVDMCRDAVANGELPEDVRAAYPRQPQYATLGGVSDIAGAFALARGYRRPGTNLHAAREWARAALELGRRAGATIPERLPARTA